MKIQKKLKNPKNKLKIENTEKALKIQKKKTN